MSRTIDLDAVGGPEGLRAIAAAMEKVETGARARSSLSAEAREELAEMLAAGRKPTIGWWRRHGTHIRAESPARPPSTWAVSKWAAEMVLAGWSDADVAVAVVGQAVESGLRQAIAEKACARGIVAGRRRRKARYGR